MDLDLSPTIRIQETQYGMAYLKLLINDSEYKFQCPTPAATLKVELKLNGPKHGDRLQQLFSSVRVSMVQMNMMPSTKLDFRLKRHKSVQKYKAKNSILYLRSFSDAQTKFLHLRCEQDYTGTGRDKIKNMSAN